MKLVVNENIEIAYESKEDLKNLKKDFQAQDARKLKAIGELDKITRDNPELGSEFANFKIGLHGEMTPQEVYDAIDEAVK